MKICLKTLCLCLVIRSKESGTSGILPNHAPLLVTPISQCTPLKCHTPTGLIRLEAVCTLVQYSPKKIKCRSFSPIKATAQLNAEKYTQCFTVEAKKGVLKLFQIFSQGYCLTLKSYYVSFYYMLRYFLYTYVHNIITRGAVS